MNQAEENRTLLMPIIVQEAVLQNMPSAKGPWWDNAYQLLETPEQQAKHKVLLDLLHEQPLTRDNRILSSPSAAEVTCTLSSTR